MYELSILIPARNEMFLAKTIENALENIEADTEIIVVLDGEWSVPAILQHNRVNVIHTGKPIGQRAATNLAAKLSKAKYVMKVDAHCSFDKGFDRIMIENMQDDWTMVPIMRNLWAFDWKCKICGKKWYQGPTPTKCKNPDCKNTKHFMRKMMWFGKPRPQSTSYSFDSEPHFQYFTNYRKRNEYKKAQKTTQLTETMSLQGSCFMCTREKYWELKLSDEELGNWGNQGIEIACKTWLSGGKVICNQKTWYAHMFRTQGGDFGFPWNNKGNDTERTKASVRKQIWLNKLPNQKYPLSWLVKKFMPVPGWTEEKIKEISKYDDRITPT